MNTASLEALTDLINRNHSDAVARLLVLVDRLMDGNVAEYYLTHGLPEADEVGKPDETLGSSGHQFTVTVEPTVAPSPPAIPLRMSREDEMFCRIPIGRENAKGRAALIGQRGRRLTDTQKQYYTNILTALKRSGRVESCGMGRNTMYWREPAKETIEGVRLSAAETAQAVADYRKAQ